MISKFQVGLKLNLSCAKDFRNLNSMATWCINWRRLMALIIFQRRSLKLFPIIKRLALTMTACLVVNPITAGNFNFLFNCTPVGRTSDSMTVPAYRLIYWWDGRGLMLWLFVGPSEVSPVGFLLLRYSVLFTAESLSLLYLLSISWFICSGRGCIDTLGVFHANQISMCHDPYLN